MIFSSKNLICLDLLSILVWMSLSEEVRKERGGTEDICMLELFQPRCLMNEVILLRSATYGRMRVGRCVKAEEVAAHKARVGDDPLYLGCSADVLAILDQKCSGKAECDIRLSDIPDDKIQPCFPGLKMYLEISFECISIVDEERSCGVTASKSPTNILVTDNRQPICGTKYQPWTVEAPLGLKIAVSLIDFTATSIAENLEESKPQYNKNDGVIVDKAGNRNASIYTGGQQREKELYLSTGNSVNVYIHVDSSYQQAATSNKRRFILTLKAIGCSDIIPPEDAWLKRNNDVLVIGCYSSRQTWQLKCKEGSWVGVVGNCTHHVFDHKPLAEPGHKPALSDKGQVIAIVGIGGFTLAICLTIACLGAICLRRFYANSKKQRDYKTLNYNNFNSARIPPSSVLGDYYSTRNDQNQMTHSVFTSELDDVVHPTNKRNNDQSARV